MVEYKEMKRIVLLGLIILVQNVNAMSPVEIVEEFGNNLSDWCKTKNPLYQSKLEALVSQGGNSENFGCRVSDVIAQENSPEDIRKSFDVYTLIFEKKIREGLSVKYSNIQVDNSLEYSDLVFGSFNRPICVSCDIHVDGALKYDVKDVFYIRNGKITAIADYYSDKNFNRALYLCKQKKYQEALDFFEQIAMNPIDFYERKQASLFSLSLLMKKKSHLDLGRSAIKYKIARHCYADIHLFDESLPLLDENNYDIAAKWPNRTKARFVQLPHNLQEAIPYLHGSLGFCDHEYFRNIYIPFRPVEKTRFAFKKKDVFGYKDEKDKTVITPQFSFAYPFDEKVGLALVRYSTGKWGYIDKQGKPRFQNYDVAADIFIDGKTYVIDGDILKLMNTQGETIKSLRGYIDLAHPLNEKEILAVYKENNRIRYDLLDFDGNITAKDCGKMKPSILYKYEMCGGCTLKYGGRKSMDKN